jgi:hypothetical protein
MLPFSKVGPIKLRQLANGYSDIILRFSLQRIIVKGYTSIIILRLGLGLWLELECSLGNSCAVVLVIPISILTR